MHERLLRKVERELSETAEKGSFKESKYLNAMELGGNMAYAAALDAAIGAATAGASEAIKPDKLEKIKKVYDFLQDLREAFGALQKAEQRRTGSRFRISGWRWRPASQRVPRTANCNNDLTPHP